MNEPDDRTLTRYLLAELDESEQEQVEQRYFADDRTHERLLVLEDELIADYARNVLPADVRRRVESRLLASPANRQRADVLAALWAGIDVQVARRPRVPAWMLTAAAIAFVSIGGWLAFENARLRDQVRSGPNAGTPDARGPDPAAAPAVTGGTSARSVLALTLRPGMVRAGSEFPTLRITGEAAVIELTLILPPTGRQQASSVTIRTPDDREVWSDRIDNSASSVLLRVPITAVPPDDYEVRVLGPGPPPATLAEYYFGTRR